MEEQAREIAKEQAQRVRLLRADLYRNIKVPLAQIDADNNKNNNNNNNKNNKNALAVAQENSLLVDLLLRGPYCLDDVVRHNVNNRPEVRALIEEQRRKKRIRRREERRLREMRARLGIGVEEEEPKSKPEDQWLYQDRDGRIMGPSPNSTMRGWYQKGKLPMNLLVYKIPDHEGAALTDDPPPPSTLSMPARGQGPSALGSVWNPNEYPHRQRRLPMEGKFQLLRVVLTENGGVEETFGKKSNLGAMFAIKMMSSKWKKKSKGTTKHLRTEMYDSDESSGLEDDNVMQHDRRNEQSWEEIEQKRAEERIEKEELKKIFCIERKNVWMDADFIEECDPVSKRTALANACDKGWFDVAKVMLLSGNECRLDVKDRYGCTPLNLAAKKGHLHIVEFILNQPGGKESMSIKDNSYHWSPLVWAAGKGYLEITQALLAAGADPENYQDDGVTGLWEAGPLGVASGRRGNQWVVKELLRAGADVNRVGGESGRITPLHAAAAQGNSNVVDALLKTGKCLTNARDSNTNTALMLACRGGHLRCARMLMDLGADWTLQSSGGWTALMFAAEGGFEKIVYRMLHWKKIPRTTSKGDTVNVPPSQVTSSQVPTLPSLGGRLSAVGMAKFAAKRVHDRAAQAVLDRNDGVAPTTQHFMGVAYTPTATKTATSATATATATATTTTAKSSSRTFFNTQGSKLSRHKLAMVASQEAHTSCNALHLAARFGHLKVLEHLLKCKLPNEIVDCRSGTSQTPLGHACCFGHLEIVELLLKHGAGVEERQGDPLTGLTPLMQAAAHGHVQVVRELLKVCNTEALDEQGRNAGQIAAEEGHREVFQFIAAERKVQQRARAAELRVMWEKKEALEEAVRLKELERRQKEAAYRNEMLRKNKEIERRKREEEEEKKRGGKKRREEKRRS